MSLQKCKTCGKPVAEDAQVCPHCGQPDPYVNPIPIIITLVVFAIIGIYLAITNGTGH